MEYRGVQYTVAEDDLGWRWSVVLGSPPKIKFGHAGSKSQPDHSRAGMRIQSLLSIADDDLHEFGKISQMLAIGDVAYAITFMTRVMAGCCGFLILIQFCDAPGR
jgi:hypothetical protein